MRRQLSGESEAFITLPHDFAAALARNDAQKSSQRACWIGRLQPISVRRQQSPSLDPDDGVMSAYRCS